jgi:hypothetical protein
MAVKHRAQHWTAESGLHPQQAQARKESKLINEDTEGTGLIGIPPAQPPLLR